MHDGKAAIEDQEAINRVGERVGRIDLVELLGRGGMGEVYLGYDEKLKRRVAVKAILGEKRFDVRSRARFLREARILSQLDHPAICRIYEIIEDDAGIFLILEYVDGRDLAQALANEELDFAMKLRVAERIALALTAAHSNGVTHRDLKPENVMLTPEGGVKVLDFGLAQKVEVDDSPESIELRLQAVRKIWSERDATVVLQDGIDSDLDEAEPDDSNRTISKTLRLSRTIPLTPQASSSRESVRNDAPRDDALTEHGAVMGTVRYMSPEQACGLRATAASDMYSFGLLLQVMFTGESAYPRDLGLMQLLHRASAGETNSVDGLDADLKELIEELKSLNVEARPTAAAAVERLRSIYGKPGRRLRQALIAACFAVLLAFGFKYTFDLRREQALAVEARQEAEQVSEFLVGLFEISGPGASRGADVTARELLEASAVRIRTHLHDQPLSRARIMLTMGRVYRQLGLYEDAEPLLAEAAELRVARLGEEHAQTALALDQLAGLAHDLGDYDRAERLFARALRIREALFGSDHLATAATLSNLAFVERARGDDEQAESLFSRALDVQRRVLGEEHPDVALSLSNLGDLYRTRGDLGLAQRALGRAVELQEALYGDDHPQLAVSLNNLATVHHARADAQQAESLYLRALKISRSVLGANHPNVALGLGNLAELYRIVGRLDEAEPLYRQALQIQEASLGADHPAVADTLAHLARLRLALRSFEDAETLLRRTLRIRETTFGVDHESVAAARLDLVRAHLGLGRFDEIESLLQSVQEVYERGVETAAPAARRAARHRLAEFWNHRAAWAEARGDSAQAVSCREKAIDIMTPLVIGSESAAFLHTQAVALLALDREAEARPFVERLKSRGWSHPEFLRRSGDSIR